MTPLWTARTREAGTTRLDRPNRPGELLFHGAGRTLPNAPWSRPGMFMSMVTIALGLTVGMALLTASSALWRSRRRLLPWLRRPHRHRANATTYWTSSYLKYPDYPLPDGE